MIHLKDPEENIGKPLSVKELVGDLYTPNVKTEFSFTFVIENFHSEKQTGLSGIDSKKAYLERKLNEWLDTTRRLSGVSTINPFKIGGLRNATIKITCDCIIDGGIDFSKFEDPFKSMLSAQFRKLLALVLIHRFPFHFDTNNLKYAKDTECKFWVNTEKYHNLKINDSTSDLEKALRNFPVQQISFSVLSQEIVFRYTDDISDEIWEKLRITIEQYLNLTRLKK